MSARFMHVVACVRSARLIEAEEHFTLCIDHIWFICYLTILVKVKCLLPFSAYLHIPRSVLGDFILFIL